ncbi:DUF1622 domain-containing protein [Hyphomicrobium sp.]|uniref:DUF1622 domain-containing protein n=1 Tax=Hyphomicrobium sp. TaxID=82 RepID=UPI0025B91E29|nr:DUF1622 domain-containing protein [Hyphomicrobium sp.]MCC7253649.1 DUF1622 domain-containing protein [Hyphomicrobium sp.]
MEAWLVEVTRAAVLIIDAMALVTIVAGTVEAFVSGIVLLLSSRTGHERRDVWLRYARWLVAGLTFQLASDIIETSITTSWEAVARVGAIAVIRTMLNYFLERDLAEVRERQRTDVDHVARTPRHAAAGE